METIAPAHIQGSDYLCTCVGTGQETNLSDAKKPCVGIADVAARELPAWLKGDPIAEHLRSLGDP